MDTVIHYEVTEDGVFCHLCKAKIDVAIATTDKGIYEATTGHNDGCPQLDTKPESV